MEKNYSRVSYIDVIAGIMITWMILGHCRYFSNITLPFFKFLGFYMPWFFYKSGLFFSTKLSKELIKKDVNKLFRSFVIYSVVGWCVWCVCGLIGGTLDIKGCFLQPIQQFVHHGSIEANGALWFLLSLFIVRQLSNVLIDKQLLPPPILAIICFIIATALYALGWYNHSWWLGNVFSGMCFFLLGYWLKEKENNKFLFIISTLFFGLVVLAYCLDLINDFPYLYMHANKMYKGNYLLFYPTALAGIIMTNNLFRILCKKVRFRVLEYIGKNSMTFYTTHWILFIVVSFVAKFIFKVEEPLILFIVLIGSAIVFLPLINLLIGAIKTMKKNN